MSSIGYGVPIDTMIRTLQHEAESHPEAMVIVIHDGVPIEWVMYAGEKTTPSGIVYAVGILSRSDV